MSTFQQKKKTTTLFRSQNISRRVGTTTWEACSYPELSTSQEQRWGSPDFRPTGYYWSFAPAFTDITLPITHLLEKNIPFSWSQKCQAALDYLKEIFCSKPILQFSDPNKKIMSYIPMLQTMLTLVYSVNLKIIKMISGL